MKFNFFHSELHKDYTLNFQRVDGFYQYPPRVESLTHRCGKMPENSHRDLLAKILREYNVRLGAPEDVLENIDLLAEPGTAVIIGGQQAGLFTGPLMTLYKAMDIINRAQEASQKTGRPVVPVFWVPGDDHDFREVNHLWITDSENKNQKISLNSPFQTRPISFIPRKESFLEAVNALEKKTPRGRFKNNYLDLLRETGQKSGSLGEWFARIMISLLGHQGLILFDPMASGVAELKKEFISLFKPAAADFYQAVSKKEKELEEAGYHVQVQKDNRHTNFFVILGGERRPVFKQGNRFQSRGGDLDLTEDEFWDLMEKEPASFSPDALLRPIFQDFVFPVLASINGPGELAYQGQLRLGYRTMGLEQPPLFPRKSLTLVEERLLRHMEKWEVAPREFLEEGEKLWDKIVFRHTGVDLENIFNPSRREIREIYEQLMAELKNVHPNLEDLACKNLKRILKEVDYLEGRSREFQVEKEKTLSRQFDKILNSLYPGEKLQERVLNVFPFLMRYGPELLGIIQKGLKELKEEHGFLTTDGRWK